MNFEEFLKKESRYPENRHPENSMCISVQALGEWAWEIVKTTLKEANYESDWDEDAQNLAGVYGFFEDDFSDTPVLEIAVACLGEKEVKKRLKFLQEKVKDK